MDLTFFTLKDLAKMSGESVAVWRKRIYQRQIRFVKFSRNVRVSLESYEDFINSRTVEGEVDNTVPN